MHRTRRALGLIEMLVVAAVIAVLAALLLPGLKTVQESARTARCLGSMRQIGMAQGAFSQDHRGAICPADGFGWWDDAMFWNRMLAPYVDDEATRQVRSNHISSVSWGCPSWASRQDYILKAAQGDYWSTLYTQRTSGYAMSAAFQGADTGSNEKLENSWWFVDNNRYITPNPDRTSTDRWARRFAEPYQLMVRLPQIPLQARQPLVIDGYMHYAHPWYQAYSNPLGRRLVIERHRGKGGCLFVDGHTGLLTGEQWARTFWRPDLAWD